MLSFDTLTSPCLVVTAVLNFSGTKEIKIGVDDDGFIFLGYEAVEMNDDSEFIWSKNYTEPIDSQRMKAETTKNR